MIFLQSYSETRGIGREEQAVMHHAIMERIPTKCIHTLDIETLIEEHGEPDLFVGSVAGVASVMKQLGLTIPKPDYYPDALKSFLGRNIWHGSTSEVRKILLSGREIFVKPKDDWKSFTGLVLAGRKGVDFINDLCPDCSLMISDVVGFIAEFRVYVAGGKIAGVCQYTGEKDYCLDLANVKKSIQILKDNGYKTDTYAIDWGITCLGDVLLVEMNGAFSIGKYKGITDEKYYTFLKLGWAFLIEKNKECLGYKARV